VVAVSSSLNALNCFENLFALLRHGRLLRDMRVDVAYMIHVARERREDS